jgi:hypothetical protein
MLHRELGWLQVGKLKVKGCNKCQWVAPFQLAEDKQEMAPEQFRRIIKAAFSAHRCVGPSLRLHPRMTSW